MVSGRGLGFTGGTLDKLESIPGKTDDINLSSIEFTLPFSSRIQGGLDSSGYD